MGGYGWLYVLLIFCTPFGLALGAVGLVVLLCERSWGKPAGSMGSRRMLLAALALCLPGIVLAASWLAW
jgi:hypothetical protein